MCNSFVDLKHSSTIKFLSADFQKFPAYRADVKSFSF